MSESAMPMRGENLPDVQEDLSAAKSLGDRIRRRRIKMQLSLQALADRVEIPASVLSKIELGQHFPSFVNAVKIAHAIDTNLGFLADDSKRSAAGNVRIPSAARRAIAYPEMGMTMHDLSDGSQRGVLEARHALIEAGAASDEAMMTHDGEEFCHVLKGALHLRIGDRHIDLAEGDSIHFKCSLPHQWRNPTDAPIEVLWVFSTDRDLRF